MTTIGFIVTDDLSTIPCLRITGALLDSIEFSLLSDETMKAMKENFRCDKVESSRVIQEHYERVKRIYNLMASKGRGRECHNQPYLRGMGPIGIRYKDETQWYRSPSPTTCREKQDYDPNTYGEEFNSALLEKGTPLQEYIVEYRPTQVSRYHSPGGHGMHGCQKNRPTMLGQNRPLL